MSWVYIPSCWTDTSHTHHFTSYSAGGWSYIWSYQGQVHTWYCLINATHNSCTLACNTSISTATLAVKLADQVLLLWSRSCRSWTLLGMREWQASALATIIRREFSESITDVAKSSTLRFWKCFNCSKLQDFFKRNSITKPYKYSSSSNLPNLAWLVVLNNLVALIKSLWAFVAGAIMYGVICWIPKEFESDKTW